MVVISFFDLKIGFLGLISLLLDFLPPLWWLNSRLIDNISSITTNNTSLNFSKEKGVENIYPMH